jgi:hypothetical protein
VARSIGTSGIQIFKIAGTSISGWVPFWKGDAAGRQAMPFTSEHEYRAALALLFDPRVAYAQRADVSSTFVDAHRLVYRLPSPVAIPYVFDDGGLFSEHDYYPDFVGVLTDGSPFLGEAGPARSKSSPEERAKAAAARQLMQNRGGSFFLLTGEALTETRFANYAILRSHFQPVRDYDRIAPEVVRRWRDVEPRSVNEVAALLSPRFDADVVAEVAWRAMCLAAIQGHLVVDLDSEALTADTPVHVLPRTAPMILPPDLPSDLRAPSEPTPETVPVLSHGPTIDTTSLPPKVAARVARDERFLALVHLGRPVAEAARTVGFTERHGYRVLDRERRTETPIEPDPITQTSAHPIYVDALRTLLRSKRTLSMIAIRESPEMRAAWLRVLEETQRPEPIPSRWVLDRLRTKILQQDAVARARTAGTRHPERPATSVRGYVRRVPAPGLVCQVDEHQFDILLTLDDVEVASRVWGAVLVDVKTSALLGAVLSPAELMEEDYMRLLKQAMEPKDAIVERFGCEYDWPCSARPGEIFSDRGLIFRSARSTSVVVDRLGITQKIAPPWAPSAKGTVEAVFRFMTQRFAHRFPATTKNSPARRGQHDPVATAKAVRMTFAEFEGYFYRAVVDGYMQAWDGLRGGFRAALWTDAVNRHGVARWLGTEDELKLLLMRAANRRHRLGRYPVHKNGVSFLGHWYVGHENLTANLRVAGVEVDILYDRRDITTIYLVDAAGTLVGPASTSELGPGPVSIWERDARRRAQSGPRALASQRSADALTGVQVDAARKRPSRAERAEHRRDYRETTFDEHDIHLDGVPEERVDRARERDGVIRLLPDLPGPDFEREPAKVPRIEYLDRDRR